MPKIAVNRLQTIDPDENVNANQATPREPENQTKIPNKITELPSEVSSSQSSMSVITPKKVNDLKAMKSVQDQEHLLYRNRTALFEANKTVPEVLQK